jgi:hypothetical protein
MLPDWHSPRFLFVGGVMDIKENDIFQWRYLDDKTHSDYLNYWCKSRIMICRNGILKDTYWSGSDGFAIKVKDAQSKLILTYIGNLDELKTISKHDFDYYADDDIVDISHENSTGCGFLVKKDAKRCKDKILKKLNEKAEYAKDQAQWALNRHKDFIARIEQLENGEIDLEKVYI